MPQPYNPAIWYWNVATNPGNVYSSAGAAYVATSNGTYLAWVALGNTATNIATEAELWAVLANQYPAGIATSNSTGLEAIRAYRVSVLGPGLFIPDQNFIPLSFAPEFGVALFVVASNVLVLTGRGSFKFFINGVNYQIDPTNFPAISNSGLSPSTLYYVYAYWTGAAIALEFSSSTAFSTGTYGQLIKSGDQSRTYVGMIYTTSGSTFVDSATQRFCASYYNRTLKPVQRAPLIALRTTTATSMTEFNSAERIEFITHGDEFSQAFLFASLFNDTNGSAMGAGLGLNGAATIIGQNLVLSIGTIQPLMVTVNYGYQMPFGYNFLTPLGQSSVGCVLSISATFTGFGAYLRQ